MSRSPLVVRFSVHLYGIFTRLYPAGFRRQYGRDMAQVFDEWANHEWERRRWLGLTTVWLQTFVDLFRSIGPQHVAHLKAVATSDPHSTDNSTPQPTPALLLVQGRKLVVYGIGFGVLNTCLWFTTPTIRAAIDGSSGRLDSPDRPFIVRGVQELLVYFDPWLAWYVFPVVFTVGFALIPFLWIPRSSKVHASGQEALAANFVWVWLSSRLLITLEIVWLFLTWVGVWCRGPDWNFYWPGECWDSSREVVLNLVDLSELFWTSLIGWSTQEMSWLTRELPGLVVVFAYFAIGFLLIARKRWNQAGFWPLATTTALMLIALAIPAKIFFRTVWDLRYLISIPEIHLNI